MTIILRQSTASQEIPVGYFLDSGDGDTEETGLTIANTDIKLWKSGATTLADKNSGGGTHISNGIYYATLDATDTNTIGPLVIFCHVSGALATKIECVVLDEAVYDVLFGTTAPSTYAGGDTSGTTTLLSRVVGTLASGTHNAQSGDTYARLGAPAGASVSADVAAVKAQTAAIETDTQDLQTQVGTDGAGLTAIGDTRLANLDATVSSRLATAGYTAPLDAAGIRTAVGMSTNNLDTQLAALPTDADVQTAAAAALTAYDPPTKAELDSGFAGLNDPTAAAVADAVWDEAIGGHTSAGSTSKALIDVLDDTSTSLPLAIASITPQSAADIRAEMDANSTKLAAIVADTNELQTNQGNWLTADVSALATAAALATVDGIVDDILVDTGTTLPGTLATIAGYVDTEVAAILAAVDTEVAAIKAKTDNLPAAPAATGDIPTAAAVADAVWDEAIAGHAGVGSTGEALTAAGSAGDPWATALPGAYGSGTAGKIIGDNINATVSSRASQTSVDDLPTNAELASALASADDATLAAIGALNNLSSAQAQTAAAAALTAYDPPTKAELDNGLAALNDLDATAVQAAAAAALAAYDPPTNAEMVARTLLAASYFDPATDTVARVTLVDTTTTNTDMVAAAPSAATVADAVWDEALSGHAAAGSTGAALTAASAAGDPWSTALPGAYGAGTAGKLLSDIEAVAPDNKPTIAATGEASANVTLWAGDAVGDAPVSAVGNGAISFPVTVNDEDSNPIDGVEVWISTDSAGASVVAGTLHTSALGVATFMLDAGTYYLWRQKSGYNFTNPVTITVS